jgi:hypothetical protein
MPTGRDGSLVLCDDDQHARPQVQNRVGEPVGLGLGGPLTNTAMGAVSRVSLAGSIPKDS